MRTSSSPARRPVRSLGDVAAALARPVRTSRSAPPGAVTVRSLRRSPVTLGDAVARQSDGTTCGSAALLMLAATGDPVLSRWLEEGTLPDGVRIDQLPREIPPAALARRLASAERLAAAQRHIRARTSARGLGPLPWPPRLGTTPWAAAREARFPGVRYVHRPVDDRGASGRAMVDLVLNALSRGLPVLLFTGGNLGQGVARALPRHVVLAVPNPTGRVTAQGQEVISIFEPATGAVHEMPAADLVDRDRPHPALGNWTHVQWLVLPVPLTHGSDSPPSRQPTMDTTPPGGPG